VYFINLPKPETTMSFIPSLPISKIFQPAVSSPKREKKNDCIIYVVPERYYEKIIVDKCFGTDPKTVRKVQDVLNNNSTAKFHFYIKNRGYILEGISLNRAFNCSPYEKAIVIRTNTDLKGFEEKRLNALIKDLETKYPKTKDKVEYITNGVKPNAQPYTYSGLGITNFVGYFKTGLKHIHADLVFDVYLFSKDNNKLITNISGKYVEKIDYDLSNRKIIINQIEYFLFFNNIIFNIEIIDFDEAFEMMLNNQNKQQHFIYITNQSVGIGRNMFGYNFSAISSDILSKKTIIHEVFHSISDYGDGFGSHNTIDSNSFMVGTTISNDAVFTITDIDAIVSNDYQFNNKIFYTNAVDILVDDKVLGEKNGYLLYKITSIPDIQIGRGLFKDLIYDLDQIKDNIDIIMSIFLNGNNRTEKEFNTELEKANIKPLKF
jgi:hypothetical protein